MASLREAARMDDVRSGFSGNCDENAASAWRTVVEGSWDVLGGRFSSRIGILFGFRFTQATGV